MKPARLKPGKPPKRKAQIRRKARIKPVSDRKRQEKRETDPLRRGLAELTGRCEACGKLTELDCHEIPAGAHRHRAIRLFRTWLFLCRPCHDYWQGRPIAEQFELAVEAMRNQINEAVGRKVV